jgi:phospholipase C
MSGMSRRSFLRRAGALAALPFAGTAALAAEVVEPQEVGFDHLVVVTMENRSFDHLLGWLPGADGRQAGLTYRDASGRPHSTYRLAPDFQGCALADPAHSATAALVQYAGGACDGWLRASGHDTFSIGYYAQRDLPFLGRAAPQWTVLSRYFAAALAGTFANRICQHAGRTDRMRNSLEPCTLPTIWDRLAHAGIDGRYYWSDLPILALWRDRYVDRGRPTSAFFSDCATGDLPAVSFVDPALLHERSGGSRDDHPHSDIRDGEVFMYEVYRAVTTGPAWPRTLLVFTFDEWGGFFDHVRPPRGRGFRVPCLLISPHARRGHIGATTYDHTSILRTIESRWELAPLAARDRAANDLTAELDLTASNLSAPPYSVPSGPFGVRCAVGDPANAESSALVDIARASGWPV